MKYKGIELVELTKPQIFDPPKKMLVWGDNDKEAYVENIYVIGPSSMDLPVRAISEDGRLGTHCYKHCAEIPEPKQRIVTHREFSKWLAQGNGEYIEPHVISSNFSYCPGNEDDTVECHYQVRKWDDTEWHEPTVDYMGIE